MDEKITEDDKVLQALEALKRVSKDVESHPPNPDHGGFSTSPSVNALLQLETQDLLSDDPNLSNLSLLLSRLKFLAFSLTSPKSASAPDVPGGGCGAGGTIRSYLRRRSSGHEISRVAGSIGSEIQSWIDRENIDRLIMVLRSGTTTNDEEKVVLLGSLEARLAEGFNRGLQDALLRAGAYAAIESALIDPAASKRVRDSATTTALALVGFNKAVFVGPLLMGPAVCAMVTIASAATLRALCRLVVSIKSPLVDELHSRGQILKILSLLSPTADVEISAAALDIVLEIGYFGRKEAIEAMLEGGIVRRLLELQRSELGGALIGIEGGGRDGEEGHVIRVGVVGMRRDKGRRRYLDEHPFASSVARFAVAVEVGEGLRQREKRAFKPEVVRRVREAAADEAEAATALAEVLWGSTPW